MSLGITHLTSGELALAVGGLLVETTAVVLFAIYWARRTVRGD